MAQTVAFLPDPLCVAGTKALQRVRPIDIGVESTWRDGIGGERGSCHLEIAADSPAILHARVDRVVRIYDDVLLRPFEYRVDRVVRGPNSERVVVTGIDLFADMQDAPLVTTVGGVPKFVLPTGPFTPAEWIQNFFIPALQAWGITHIVIGDITPTDPVSLSLSETSVAGGLAALEGATKYECWLEPNDDVEYRIMLGFRTASGTPCFFVGSNVETLEYEEARDEKMMTCAYALAGQVNGEEEKTGLQQHGWAIGAVAGDDVTLAHPLGAAGPIGEDAQLDDLVAGVSLDLAPMKDVATVVNQRTIAYDPVHRTVWELLSRLTNAAQWDLFWRDLRDGSCGSLSIAGATDLRSIVIDPTRDELFVACNDAAKLERISLSTKLSVGNVACGANPSALSNLRLQGVGQLAIGYSAGAVGIKLIDLATLANPGNLNTTAAGNQRCAYDPGSARYFCWGPSTPNVTYYDATYANLGTLTPFGATAVATGGLDAGVLTVIEYSGGHGRAITCATGAMGAAAPLSPLDGVAINPSVAGNYDDGRAIAPVLGGRLYLHEAAKGALCAIDVATFALDGYVITPGAPFNGFISTYDPSDDCWAIAAEFGAVSVWYRNGALLPSGRLRFVVQDSVAATQVIVKPLATRGPILPGQLVEFRENAADQYRRFLTAPSALERYKARFGKVTLADMYLRNYKRDPYFDEWHSNRPVWTGLAWPSSTNVASMGQPRWASADAQPIARATTGMIDGAQTKAASTPTTLNLKGLAAGRVMQCGDWILHATGYFSVLDRAVADGTGHITVGVMPEVSATYADTTPVTIYSPAQADGPSSYMVALPIHHAIAETHGCLHGGSHLPSIQNASQAWIRWKFLALTWGGDTAAVSLTTRGPYAFGTINAPSFIGTRLAPVWSTLVVEQQLPLNTVPPGTDAFLDWQQSGTGQFQLWAQSVEIYIATATACPDPMGAFAGGELVPWVACNDLLFTQMRAQPSLYYKISAHERPGVPHRTGQIGQLRDPTRALAAAPRIVTADYRFSADDQAVQAPVLELQTRAPSAMEALAQVGN